MIITENHPDNKCVFVKCDECDASCIQGTTGQANILKHKKWCDSNCTPTAAQLSGREAPVLAPDTAPASPEAAPAGFEYYHGPGAPGGRQLIEVGRVEQLRNGGHSWRDIGEGNHDF